MKDERMTVLEKTDKTLQEDQIASRDIPFFGHSIQSGLDDISHRAHMRFHKAEAYQFGLESAQR